MLVLPADYFRLVISKRGHPLPHSYFEAGGEDHPVRIADSFDHLPLSIRVATMSRDKATSRKKRAALVGDLDVTSVT